MRHPDGGRYGVGVEQTSPVGQLAGLYSEGRDDGAVVWWVDEGCGVPLWCPPSWLAGADPPPPPPPDDSLLVSQADSVSTAVHDSIARTPAAERRRTREWGADTVRLRAKIHDGKP